MDTLSFFHKGTLSICSSLDINTMLEDCLGFLKSFMPLNGIIFNIYNSNLKAIECIGAKADIPVHIPKKPIYLSKEGIAFIESDLDVLRKVDDFTTYGATSKAVARALKLPQASGYIRHLTIQNEIVGVVIIFATGKKKLEKEHGRLLSLLNDPFAIALSNILRYRELKKLRDLLNEDNRYLYQELRKISGEEIIGKDSGLKEVMTMAYQVAPLNSKVLLLGETGVGKEVIANAIHYSSPRKNKPFIKVNCGAIADALIDSELFGHEKGSFTGAISMKRGKFERARGGTIFLDEIGEMPLALQKRLLRVLQTGELERVGGMEPIKVDARVIAATNRNLEELVKKGEFREDLWYRLNVFPITIPPLRQRKNDIPELIRFFIHKKVVELNLSRVPEIDPAAFNRIKDYPWPGNVRELENAVERELIRCQAEQKKTLYFSNYATDTPVYKTRSSRPDPITADTNHPPPALLDDAIRQHITATLEKTGGKIQGDDGAAKLLGLHPSTLRHKLRKLDIAFGRKVYS